MVIESVSNKNAQLIRRLSNRNGRVAEGLFVVEGINIIKDIPPSIKLHSLYIAQSKAEKYRKDTEKFACPVTVLSDRVFKAVSDTVTPSGILALAPLPKAEPLESLGDRIIVLDGIRDSGNVGTALRSAAAFGYRDVILIDSADAYSGKTIRSSMGGVFRTRIFELSRERFVSEVTHPLWILDMKGENLRNVTPLARYALAVGNEARGASNELRAKAARSLSIGMKEGTESLNAAVSISIAMFLLGADC